MINKAIEQQTISVTKAGLHATLNARVLLLVAANLDVKRELGAECADLGSV